MLMTRLLVLLFLSVPLLVASPWERHVIDASEEGADGVRLADVNGDGLVDIATAWEQSGAVKAYLNPGADKAASEWPSVIVGRVESPEDAVFVDIDGDGKFEVISSTEGEEKTIYVHQSKGDGFLDAASWETRPVVRSAGKNQWMYAEPIDVDGNGSVDIVAGSKNDFAMIGSWRFPSTPGGRGLVEPLVRCWLGDVDRCPRHERRWGSRYRGQRPQGSAERGAVVSEHARQRRVARVQDRSRGRARGHVPRCGRPRRRRFDRRCDGSQGRTDPVLPRHVGPGQQVAATLHSDPRRIRHGQGPWPSVTWTWTEPWILVFSCEHATDELSGVGLLRHSGDPTASQWEVTDVGGPDGTKFDRIELVDSRWRR